MDKYNISSDSFFITIWSPTLNKLAHAFKSFSVQTFCQDVSPLFFCVDLYNVNCAVANMGPEEVPFDLEVLGAIGDSLVGRHKKSTIVVFEDLTLNGWDEGVGKGEACDDFNKHGSQRQESTHGGTECRIFGVDSVTSVWRWDFHKMGQPPRVMMYPVRDFAELGEWSGSRPCKPAKSAST